MSDEVYWVPIESNPDVMNKFMSNIGVPDGIGIVDVIGLDDELLQFIEGPVLSLILLYPANDNNKSLMSSEAVVDPTGTKDGLYFMRQTIRNACGTIALIHALANNYDNINLKPDSILKTFLDSTKDLSPEKRGQLLESNVDFCKAHHSCASDGQTSAPAADANIDHHFVAIVHKNGFLYVLDGNIGSLNYGETSEQTFLSDAARVCRQVMSRDPDNLNFTVVALTGHSTN